MCIGTSFSESSPDNKLSSQTTAPSQLKSIAPNGIRIDFESFRLSNGLHVILHENHDLPIVSVNLWYHVGSKNEAPGKTGFAHLFEHMMFQGSANVGPNQHFHFVQEAGGSLNASTSFDRTNYFETLPSHRLELGLWLESDRMLSLNVTEETLELQRSVVMEERRSRYDNQPYGTLYEDLFRTAFAGQPYQWPVIGTMEDIRSMTLEDVRAFHRRFYRPSNASLCISGDFERNEADRLVRLYFDEIPDLNHSIERPPTGIGEQTQQAREIAYDAVPLPAIVISMPIPDMNHPDSIPLELLSLVLSSGDSSRLYQRLVYRDRVAKGVITFAFALELTGLFVFRSTAQKEKAPEEIEERFWEEIRAVREHGITPAELEKAKNQIEASFLRDISTVHSRADLLNMYHVLYRDIERIIHELALIRSVTIEDVHRVAKNYLHERTSTVLYCLPESGERSDT